MFEELRNLGFQIEMHHHAEAILTHDMPNAALEIESVLASAHVPSEELVIKLTPMMEDLGITL